MDLCLAAFRYCAAALLSLVACTSAAFTVDLIGQASIVDGDTLEIHGARIRLWGVDAPESSQLCRGEDSLQYRCGAKAANELAAFIGERPVSCAPTSLDRYGRTVASCAVGGTDLADWLVSQGWRWTGRDTAAGSMLRLRMMREATSGAYGQAASSSHGAIAIASGAAGNPQPAQTSCCQFAARSTSFAPYLRR
ncbi:thermonuclease family protein [Bradyrhizobium japonicum]